MARNTIIVFLGSLGLGLLLTPLARHIAIRFGIVDSPSARKVHNTPIPRIGGVAICLAFYLPVATAMLLSPALREAGKTPLVLWMLVGSFFIFVMGLIDDMRGLSAKVKLGIQVVLAVMAYAGGIRITEIVLPWGTVWVLNLLSFPVTIFWILLFINALNLIDGLDGLAAGITVFASIALLIISWSSGQILTSLLLAAMAGASLGFLRYNFNPASVFMGDSGSYFLGYMLGTLSIIGSWKSRTTVAILIPIIALGMPLFDTILAPIRRFVVGKRLFQPDKNHIHHRLLKMGFTHRNAVLVIYGASVILCILALLLEHSKNQESTGILLFLGVLVALAIQRLGYMNYVGMEKLVCYAKDVADEIGFNKERRSFLDKQMAINEAGNIVLMWHSLVLAVQFLSMDFAEMRLNSTFCGSTKVQSGDTDSGNGCTIEDNNSTNGHFIWKSDAITQLRADLNDCLLVISLPLISEGKSYGTILLRKDLSRTGISHYTLKRVEHLRRSIIRKLKIFELAVPAEDGSAKPLKSTLLTAPIQDHNGGSRGTTARYDE